MRRQPWGDGRCRKGALVAPRGPSQWGIVCGKWRLNAWTTESWLEAATETCRPLEARVGIRALGAAKGALGKAGRPCCRLRRCREAGPGACVQLATLSRTPGLQKPTDLYVIPAVPPTSSCPRMPPASLFLSHSVPGPPAKVFKTVFKNPEFTSIISH